MKPFVIPYLSPSSKWSHFILINLAPNYGSHFIELKLFIRVNRQSSFSLINLPLIIWKPCFIKLQTLLCAQYGATQCWSWRFKLDEALCHSLFKPFIKVKSLYSNQFSSELWIAFHWAEALHKSEPAKQLFSEQSAGDHMETRLSCIMGECYMCIKPGFQMIAGNSPRVIAGNCQKIAGNLTVIK